MNILYLKINIQKEQNDSKSSIIQVFMRNKTQRARPMFIAFHPLLFLGKMINGKPRDDALFPSSFQCERRATSISLVIISLILMCCFFCFFLNLRNINFTKVLWATSINYPSSKHTQATFPSSQKLQFLKVVRLFRFIVLIHF